MNNENSFLGRGWSFPFQFSKEAKSAVMLSDEEDIRNSLEILLSTTVGERIMQPDYGCNLDILLFEPINLSLSTYIKDLVFNAIYLFEPRIQPEEVILSGNREDGIIELKVNYMIRATNARHNLVFPFYTGEATFANPDNQ